MKLKLSQEIALRPEVNLPTVRLVQLKRKSYLVSNVATTQHTARSGPQASEGASKCCASSFACSNQTLSCVI